MKKMKKILLIAIIFLLNTILFSTQNFIQKATAQNAVPTPVPVGCGEIYTDKFTPAGEVVIIHICSCEESSVVDNSRLFETTYCCGWWFSGNCREEEPTGPIYKTPTPPPPTSPESTTIPPVDEDLLNNLNPLKKFSTKADKLSTPGGIITEILNLSFPIAGVILFVMLTMAGFKMLTGATNSQSMEEGKKMISTAVIGFIILFAAYWIAQLLEIIFGINILNN